jgi:hypothetical protein
MHDDSVLVAVEDATRTPNFCTCGRYMAVVQGGDAMWLECPAFAEPTRLPPRMAAAVRAVLHDRRFVVRIPEELRDAHLAGPAADRRHAPAQVSGARA